MTLLPLMEALLIQTRAHKTAWQNAEHVVQVAYQTLRALEPSEPAPPQLEVSAMTNVEAARAVLEDAGEPMTISLLAAAMHAAGWRGSKSNRPEQVLRVMLEEREDIFRKRKHGRTVEFELVEWEAEALKS